MIVIPMAGESRRFRDAGYGLPKYQLEVDGRPLFDWSVLSFEASFSNERFLFIARDVGDTAEFVTDRIGKLAIQNAQVVMLDGPTSGQAETVALGMRAIDVPGSQRITIFNIDTIRPRFQPPASQWLENKAGWLEVFVGEGDNWSFVEPDPAAAEIAHRTSEKERISDLCCTGMYGFGSRALFEAALDQERASPSKQELYIAPIYNHLIRSGGTVGYRKVSNEEVLFSGVPAEYEALKLAGNLTERF